MPPAYVKPYVKRQKNDMADAEAICEAVARANMRFVPTKTPAQQSCLMLHGTADQPTGRDPFAARWAYGKENMAALGDQPCRKNGAEPRSLTDALSRLQNYINAAQTNLVFALGIG